MKGRAHKTASARRKERREKEELKTLLLVAGDLFVTALWAVVSSTFAEAAETLAEMSGGRVAEFALAVAVTCLAIMAMGPLCDLFGGALFNPIHNAAFICAGRGTVPVNALRMVSQIAGALLGSYVAVGITPDWLKDHFHKLPGGLKPGVQLEVGVAVEVLLGLVLNLVVLHASDTKHKFVAYWSPIVATIVLIVTGSYFTGPSMNPAIAFSWFHHYQGHTWAEQVAVYWIAPFAGAMLGGLAYRLVGGKAPQEGRALPAELRVAAGAIKAE